MDRSGQLFQERAERSTNSKHKEILTNLKFGLQAPFLFSRFLLVSSVRRGCVPFWEARWGPGDVGLGVD